MGPLTNLRASCARVLTHGSDRTSQCRHPPNRCSANLDCLSYSGSEQSRNHRECFSLIASILLAEKGGRQVNQMEKASLSALQGCGLNSG